MPTTFRVSTRHSGLRRFVRVTVYETVEELRDAASKYTRRIGAHTPGEFDQAYGVTHSSQRLFFDAEGQQVRVGPSAAHIRFHRKALGTGVVTHEVAHAALSIYNQDCLENQGSVHNDMEQEEVVCYLIGDLSARIVNQLYSHGYYEEAAA